MKKENPIFTRELAKGKKGSIMMCLGEKYILLHGKDWEGTKQFGMRDVLTKEEAESMGYNDGGSINFSTK